MHLQRLMRDFKRLRNDPPQGINGSPNPDNIMHWNAVIFGPEDTPWDGGAQACGATKPVALLQESCWPTTHFEANVRFLLICMQARLS